MDNHKSFLVLKNSEIVHGCFQNAFLGFYAVSGFENQSIMSAALKLVLKTIFEELQLHRIEANIQHENTRSKNLIMRNKFRYEGFSPCYLKINNKWCGHEHWVTTYEEYIQDNAVIVYMSNLQYELKQP